MSAKIQMLVAVMLIALICPATIHVPALKASMAIPMMVVKTSTSVPNRMSADPAPFALIWRAVIAATVLQVMMVMVVRKPVALTMMNVPARHVAAMPNARILRAVSNVCVPMVTRAIPCTVVKVSARFKQMFALVCMYV